MPITYVKISELPALADPDSTAIVPVVQGGTTYQISAAFFLNKDAKDSVRAAATAALPANTRTGNVLTADANGALPAQDTVSLSVGDRLMVPWEVTGANRGIYDVTALGDGSNPWVLTRSPDADTSEKVTSQMLVPVEEGATYAGKRFLLTTPDVITLNVTSLAFTLDAHLTGPTGGQVDQVCYAGAAGDLLYANSVKILGAGAGLLAGYLALGTTYSTAGVIRGGNPFTIYGVTDPGGVNARLLEYDSNEKLFFGEDTNVLDLQFRCQSAMFFVVGGGTFFTLNGTSVTLGQKYLQFTTGVEPVFRQQQIGIGTGRVFEISAQNCTTSGDAGHMLIKGGVASGASGNGGDVRIQAGSGPTANARVELLDHGGTIRLAIAATATSGVEIGTGTMPSVGDLRVKAGFTWYGIDSVSANAKLFEWASSDDIKIGNATTIDDIYLDCSGTIYAGALFHLGAHTLLSTLQTQSGSGSKTIDWRNGPTHLLTLTGDVTLSFTNPGGAGTAAPCTLILVQDATGGHTTTWPASTIEWVNGSAPVLDETPNAKNAVFLRWYGTYFLGMYGTAFAL
jgi:hypothetical protein